MHTDFNHLTDSFYMQEALKQAIGAMEHNEVPVGALVVGPDGAILSRAYNQIEQQKSQRAHAESLAIEQAAHALNNWRLEGCTLYVTLEPCSMCMGLIGLSRIKRVVYGAESPLFGYRLDKERTPWVYKNDVVIEAGVEAEQAQRLLKSFFQIQRKKKGEYKKGAFGKGKG